MNLPLSASVPRPKSKIKCAACSEEKSVEKILKQLFNDPSLSISYL